MKFIDEYPKGYDDWNKRDVEKVMDHILRENHLDDWHDINEEIMDTDPEFAVQQYRLMKLSFSLVGMLVGRCVYVVTLKALEKTF